MISFISFETTLDQFKNGFMFTESKCWSFFEKAFQFAKNDFDINMYIDGVENSCDYNYVNFRSLKEIEPSHFREQELHIYANNLSDILKFKSSFINCSIHFYSSSISESSIGELSNILDGNKVNFVDVDASSVLENEDNYDLSSVRSARSFYSHNPYIQLDKKIIFYIDITSTYVSGLLYKVINELNYHIAIVAEKPSLLTSIYSGDHVIHDLEKMKVDDFQSLCSDSLCFIVLGATIGKNIDVIKIGALSGAPIICNGLVEKKIGIRPFMCTSQFYFDKQFSAEYARDMLKASLQESIFFEQFENYSAQFFHSEYKPKATEHAKPVSLSSRGPFKKIHGGDIFVAWIGRFNFIGGYGSVAKGYLDAMESVGIKNVCIDIESKLPVGKSMGAFWKHDKARKKYTFPKNTILVYNDLPTKYCQFKGVNFLQKVACTLFETDSFPIDWLEGLEQVDEVWVPTRFNYETFQYGGIDKSKMRIVGYSVDVDFFNSEYQDKVSGQQPLTFFYVLSNMNRKDPGLLIRSYVKAFTHEDNVQLIIKTRMDSKRFWERMKSHLAGFDINDPELPKITIISETLSEDAMRELYKNADIYVTTERAKGWDYPAMEAMCMGIPTVGIDWSGSEFLNDSNAYLIPAKSNLTRIHASQVDAAEMYFAHKWADVHEEDVIRALELAANDPELRRQKGVNCLKSVDQFRPETIGLKIKEILNGYVRDNDTDCAVLFY